MVLNDNYDDYISVGSIDGLMKLIMPSDGYFIALGSYDGASMAVGLYDGS